jgi:hypothetical protein
MRDEDAIDMQEAAEKHEAMDYAQHESTWLTFTNLVKWSIIEIAFLVLALYCFIQAGNPLAWRLPYPRRPAGSSGDDAVRTQAPRALRRRPPLAPAPGTRAGAPG